MQACDAIRHQAQQEGYAERSIFQVDAGFDWNQVWVDCGSLSLFSEKKVIEIRLPTGKPGISGSKMLEQLVHQPPPDTLILVITGKLDAATRRSKWYRAFDAEGICVQIWPLSPQQLPGWIRQRMKQLGLQPDAEAVDLLADRIEGNLLAADQEIQKLKLLSHDAHITVQNVLDSVADSSRHNVFEFVDSVLQQESGKLSRMLGNIRAEGIQAPVILWALARELRLLFFVSEAFEKKHNIDQVMRERGVWNNRQGLVGGAARRRRSAFWQSCLMRCSRIDRMIKGRADGNYWDELLQLGIRMARN